MYEEQDENTIQEPAGEVVKPLNGFIEILTQPYELGRKVIPKWFQVVAIAVLIETLCMVSGAFVISKSDGVRGEMNSVFSYMIEKMDRNPNIPKETVEETRESLEKSLDFSLEKSISWSLVMSLIPLFFIAAFFFLSARIFVEQPALYSKIIALAAYTSIISGIGTLISSMLQFVGDSTDYSLSLSFIADPTANPFVFTFFSRISLITIMYYIVLGLAVAGASRMHRNWGFVLAAIVYTFMLILWGGYNALSAMFM